MKTLLFNPFEKYLEKQLLFVGLICTLIGILFSYLFNIRFDGVIDAHAVANISFKQAILDSFLNIFCLILFLYIAAKYINKKTRLIDIITSTMIARFPIYILAIFNIKDILYKAGVAIQQFINQQSTNETSAWFIIITFSIIAIITLVWYIALLFNGFKVSSNAKGKFPIVLFVLSLILAEILSKILIYYFTLCS